MNTQTVINKFRVWVDDASELSPEEEVDLAQEKLDEFLGERTWDFLKKTATVSIVSNEITLPTDFKYILKTGLPEEYLYVKVDTKKIRLVSLQDRDSWGGENVAYIDYAESKIKFTNPTTGVSTFDYVRESDEITINSEIIGPRSVGYAIGRLMARDFYTLDQTEFGRSQYAANDAAYEKLLGQMSVHNQYEINSVE